jgi:plasmid stability protein
MSVRTTIDIPDDLHAELRRRAAAEHTSIRSLVTSAIDNRFRPRQSRPVTGPLVGKTGKKRKPAAGSPDRENPYDVLFA